MSLKSSTRGGDCLVQHEPLMQVRIPNIGRIQTLRAIQATKIATGKAKSFILLPELSKELNGWGVVDSKLLMNTVHTCRYRNRRLLEYCNSGFEDGHNFILKTGQRNILCVAHLKHPFERCEWNNLQKKILERQKGYKPILLPPFSCQPNPA